VVDAGSGAGLPGLVLAALRPDLRLELVDSMRRRCEWMEEAVAALGLENVAVTWSRVEDLGPRDAAAVVSRAVARLDRLAGWTAGLLAPGGGFLAIKGRRAAEELQECRAAMEGHGLVGGEVVEVRPPEQEEPARVVRAWRSAA
jgi:16S rRNA (guanine527-N7)-methyltransferase